MLYDLQLIEKKKKQHAQSLHIFIGSDWNQHLGACISKWSTIILQELLSKKKWEIKIIDTYQKKYTWKEGKNKTKYNSEPDQDMDQKQVDIPLKWSR